MPAFLRKCPVKEDPEMKLPHQSLTLAAIISLLVLAACQPIQAPSAGERNVGNRCACTHYNPLPHHYV